MEDHQSEGQGQIDISMETQSLSVAPGGTLTVPVSLHNQGEGDELLELSVRGIPTAWVSLPSRVVRLSPWERRDIEMTVKTPAPGSAPGATRLRFERSASKVRIT
jgi:uncharacterized membrane protein